MSLKQASNGNGNNKGNGHFGKCLRELRKKTNLNLHGLAEKTKSSPAWLSYLERGRRVPSWELVESCVAVFKDCRVSRIELARFKDFGRKAILRKVFVNQNHSLKVKTPTLDKI